MNFEALNTHSSESTSSDPVAPEAATSVSRDESAVAGAPDPDLFKTSTEPVDASRGAVAMDVAPPRPRAPRPPRTRPGRSAPKPIVPGAIAPGGNAPRPKKLRNLNTEEAFELLLQARTADHVQLFLRDTRVIEGAILFNDIKGTGRIINVMKEISVDFRATEVRDLRFA